MDNKKTLKGCGIGCLGLIVVIVILSFLLSSCIKGATEEEEKAFNFTVDEYEANLKKTISDASAGTYLEMGARSVLENNTYNFQLTDSIIAFADVNDNGELIRTRTVTNGNTFLVMNKEVLTAFKSAIKSVDPSLSVTQSMVLLEKLGITGNSSMLDHSAIYSLNGISYFYMGDIENDRLVLLIEPE